MGSWYGLSVPTGTSKEIITRLHAETIKLLALQDVKDRLAAGGFEIVTSTPEQYGEFVRAEVERWGKGGKAFGGEGGLAQKENPGRVPGRGLLPHIWRARHAGSSGRVSICVGRVFSRGPSIGPFEQFESVN